MGKKVCTAGVAGVYSYLILDHNREDVVSVITSHQGEWIRRHLDFDQASRWTENQLRMLDGRNYETD